MRPPRVASPAASLGSAVDRFYAAKQSLVTGWPVRVNAHLGWIEASERNGLLDPQQHGVAKEFGLALKSKIVIEANQLDLS